MKPIKSGGKVENPSVSVVIDFRFQGFLKILKHKKLESIDFGNIILFFVHPRSGKTPLNVVRAAKG